MKTDPVPQGYTGKTLPYRPERLGPMKMQTAKQEVNTLLSHLPDDSTLEDIQYHLYVLEKIKKGQADVAAGRTYTHAEAKERLSKWLKQ